MLDVPIGWLVDIGMAVGPIMGYVSQYQLIKKNKQVGSFSIDICGILLFANILRLNFYIFKRYQTALVFQSLLMVSMQVLLLFQCCKYPSNEDQIEAPEESQPALSSSNNYQCQNVQKFWRWNGFEKYGVTILFFIFCSFSLSVILNLTPVAKGYGELVGVVALISESILIAPQIFKNIEKQSTKGLSRMLVSFNLSGDVFKLIYFLAKNQPFQFILCGIIQVILDSFVILQIFYYGSGKKSKKQEMDQKMSPIKGSKIQQLKQSPQSDANLNYDIKQQVFQNIEKNQKQIIKLAEQKRKGQQKVQKVQKVQKGQSGKGGKEKLGEYYSLNEQIQNEEINDSKEEEQDANTKTTKKTSQNITNLNNFEQNNMQSGEDRIKSQL